MRKLFSFIAAVLFAGSMMADSYTISFKETGTDSDSNTGLTSTTPADYIATGAEYVTSVAATGKVYNARTGRGLKFGNSSNPGAVTLTLAAPVQATSIVVQARAYNDTEKSLKIQDKEDYQATTTVAEYTYTYAEATEISTITVGTASKRGYVVSVTVNYGGGVTPPTPEDTWTVAGEPTTAFGSSWTPSDASNDMVKQEDGSYKWERTGLELGAGTIKFKVVKNHAWDEAYPAQNYELAIAEAGIYTITITFEPANENNVSAVATKTGEAVVVPTVVMHGQFASNDWADTEAFAKSEDKKTATLKLTLEAKTIEFGMKFDGSWKANGANITREAASTSLAEGSGNMHLVADVAGEYTFTYTYETQVLAVTYPAEAPVVTPITCAAVYALEKNAEVTLNDVVVTYVNGKNVWVKDATGAMLLYLAADATWSAGDVLAGVEGVVDIYNGLYEVKPSADQAAAVVATPGEAPEPELLTVITDADVNKYIVIEGVTAEGEFVEGTASNITITMGDATYTLRNNFKNAYTFEAGSTYTVLALVSYYKTGIQLYFIDAEDEGGQSDLSYDYEPTTVSTFDVTIASVSVKDYVADYGVIAYELEDADGAYFAYLELISSTSEPATGIYPINFTEQDGTFYASPGGDDQYDYGCYFGVMDGEYYNPYYMVSGSVEIAEDGMTVNATSYNGSTIKLTYKAPEEAIDNTEVKASAVKFLQNDQLIIEKNGVRYNVNGQQIR